LKNAIENKKRWLRMSEKFDISKAVKEIERIDSEIRTKDSTITNTKVEIEKLKEEREELSKKVREYKETPTKEQREKILQENLRKYFGDSRGNYMITEGLGTLCKKYNLLNEYNKLKRKKITKEEFETILYKCKENTKNLLSDLKRMIVFIKIDYHLSE